MKRLLNRIYILDNLRLISAVPTCYYTGNSSAVIGTVAPDGWIVASGTMRYKDVRVRGVASDVGLCNSLRRVNIGSI